MVIYKVQGPPLGSLRAWGPIQGPGPYSKARALFKGQGPILGPGPYSRARALFKGQGPILGPGPGPKPFEGPLGHQGPFQGLLACSNHGAATQQDA